MKSKGIASRIMLSVIPIIAATLLVFVLVIRNVTDAQINKTINEKMHESLRVAGLDIENELLQNANIARNLALYVETCSRETIERGDLQAFLLRTIPSNKNTVGGGIWFEPFSFYPDQRYFGPYVYVADGQAIYAPEYSSEQFDYHSADWYDNGRRSDGRIVWSNVYFDPVAKVTMVTATAPFYDDHGQFQGVTTADMALTDIRAIAADISVGETGRAFLLGANGEFITYFNQSRTIDQRIQQDADPALATLGQAVVVNKEGTAALTLDGKPRRAYYNTLPDVGWTLVVLVDSAEIGSNTNQQVFGLAIVPLIGLLVATLSIILVARQLRSVVGKVNHFAERAASGDLSERIAITEHDEFGVMEDRLNKMMDNMSAMTQRSEEMLEIAQTASRAKSDFLSRMSHEIRTPMNAIIGMTQIASTADDMAKIRDCLTKISQASKHLLSLINDILDISKIEANKLELVSEVFDVRQEIDDVRHVIAVRADEKHQRLTAMVDPAVPPYIIADPLRYAQVITNLLSNAIKFTPEAGSIALTVRLVEEQAKQCVIETSVKDTGIGIDEAQQEALFQAFEQADGSTARKYGGTGLGLAICKSIVEMMGGRIWYASQPGQGSTFFFTMRAERADDAAVQPAAAVPADATVHDLSASTILLAEDMEINREIVYARLEATGVHIDSAINGAQACDMFAAAPDKYGLILMDLQMPEMDGFTAARTIRAMPVPQARTIPIVAMTANVFQEDVDKSLAAGMNDHIPKPIDVALLLQKVNQYLG